jgi:hypothetical protein
MRPERLRWLLLPVAAIAGALAFYRPTPGRLVTACVCGLAWYALSRGKTRSLDRERFMGGKLGAALRYWKKRSSAANL